MGGRNYSLCSTVEEFEDSDYAVGNPELTARSGFLESLPVSPLDRHRGGGHPPTPATPPCVRIRTRRFDWLR